MIRIFSGQQPQEDYLAHFGINGMKWGVRRYQNPDGTLTPAGRERYLNGGIDRQIDNLTMLWGASGASAGLAGSGALFAAAAAITNPSKKAKALVAGLTAASVGLLGGTVLLTKKIDSLNREAKDVAKTIPEVLDVRASQAFDETTSLVRLHSLDRAVRNNPDFYSTDDSTDINDPSAMQKNLFHKFEATVDDRQNPNATYRTAIMIGGDDLNEGIGETREDMEIGHVSERKDANKCASILSSDRDFREALFTITKSNNLGTRPVENNKTNRDAVFYIRDTCYASGFAVQLFATAYTKIMSKYGQSGSWYRIGSIAEEAAYKTIDSYFAHPANFTLSAFEEPLSKDYIVDAIEEAAEREFKKNMKG